MMAFPVKSCVQAIDPVCGIWFSARVIKIDEVAESRLVKWTEYPSEPASWVPIDAIRPKETKRVCKVTKKLWPSQDAKFYQRGDKVLEVRPDGSDGDVLTVEQNDPWRCQMKCGDRLYRYEHLQEFQSRNPQPITQNKEAPQSTESRQPSQSPQQSQVHQATDQIPAPETVVEEPQTNEQSNTRGKKRKSRKTQQKAKTVKVTKKSAAYITRGESAGTDNFVPEEAMLPNGPDIFRDATLTTVDMVVEASNEGYAPDVPDDWIRGPVPLLCSAKCDAEIKELKEQLNRQRENFERHKEEADKIAKEQMAEITKLKTMIEALSEKGPSCSPSQSLDNPPIDVGHTVSNALHTLLNDPTTPVCRTLSPEQDVDISTMIAFADSEENIPPELWSTIATFGGDKPTIVKYLVRKLFSHNERLMGNTSGMYGLQKLCQRKLALIKKITFDATSTPSFQQDSEWKRLKSTIDLYNRHYRQRCKRIPFSTL